MEEKSLGKWLHVKTAGLVIDGMGIIAAIGIPLWFSVIKPIGDAVAYYDNGGHGVSAIIICVGKCLIVAPLLAAVIFLPTFITGQLIYSHGDRMYKEAEAAYHAKMQQNSGRKKSKEEQLLEEDFVIVKNSEIPHDSDEGIKEIQSMLQRQALDHNSKEN